MYTALLLAAGVVAAAIGCAGLTGTVAPNQPPQTTLWVSGETGDTSDVDTVRHITRFFWDGQDVDGAVVGFEFKWIYEPGAEPAGYDSSVWFYTERTDSLFAVYTPDGANFPTFTVRAIDDQGAADPTPARQQYRFRNDAPLVLLTTRPPDTTFAVATFAWDASDPDGNISNATYRVWLEGKEDKAAITTETQYTLTPDMFTDDGGQLVPGEYKAFVIALDDGGRASEPDSFSWYVEPTVGTVLLIDDLPHRDASNRFYDGFYRQELDARVGAGNYTILDLEHSPRLRSEADVRETLMMFDHVFWYNELNDFLTNPLSMIGPGMRDHLAAGKNLYVCSTRLAGTEGALDDESARDLLGVDRFHYNTTFAPWETNFSLRSAEFFTGGSAPFDSMRSLGVHPGVEAFVLVDAAEAAYLAVPGVLDTLPPDPWPVGVSRLYGTGQGRLIYLAFPLKFMDRPFSGGPGRAPTELRKIFDLFGM
jgi:hypothetical protein